MMPNTNVAQSEYDSHKVNNLLIPTGDQAAYNLVGDAATFRDENISLNGQMRNGLSDNEESNQVSQSDALGYGTFQPDQIRNVTG